MGGQAAGRGACGGAAMQGGDGEFADEQKFGREGVAGGGFGEEADAGGAGSAGFDEVQVAGGGGGVGGGGVGVEQIVRDGLPGGAAAEPGLGETGGVDAVVDDGVRGVADAVAGGADGFEYARFAVGEQREFRAVAAEMGGEAADLFEHGFVEGHVAADDGLAGGKDFGGWAVVDDGEVAEEVFA